MEGFVKAESAARKALELDDGVPAAHHALALLSIYRDRDWSAAEREAKRAIELGPSDVFGRWTYAEALTWMGRLDEAIDQMRKASELDPFGISLAVIDLGRLYEAKGLDERALEEWDRALQLAPTYPWTHQHIGNYYCRNGEFDRGLDSLKRSVELSPEDPLFVANLGHCYAAAGRPGEARNLALQLEERSRSRYISPMSFALIHLGLGENDQAIQWLERAYEVQALLLTTIVFDERFDPLRADARFSDLVRRLGLSERSSEAALAPRRMVP